jgi:hypothetical protein
LIKLFVETNIRKYANHCLLEISPRLIQELF